MRIVIAALIVGLLACPAVAANYYVATNGSNSSPGTLSQPFLTIQQAANVVQPGDQVFIRGGTYRETVTLSRSGTAGAPISFQPYQGEQVTVTGLDPLNSGWTNYSGSIYSRSASTASQLFVGGQMMTEARFPNAGYNNPLHTATIAVDSASVNTPPQGTTVTSSGLGNPANGTWNGAKIAIASGVQTFAFYNNIDTQAGNTLSYLWAPSDPAYNPKAGNPFYLYNSLAALNAPKEWYRNASSGNLYFYAPNGASPNGQNVEVRNRSLGFNVAGSYVNLSGIQLKAANVQVGGNHNLVDNCQILYPTAFYDPSAWNAAPGVQISGQYNTLHHSEVAYSWGDGVTVTNSNNTVDNNRIHDVGWAGDDAAAVNVTNNYVAGADASSNTITNNTMYNAGRSGVRFMGAVANTTIQNNDISRFGYLTTDMGGIYTGNSTDTGSVVAYNRVHDGRTSGQTSGIYLDGNNSGTTAHHNLVYNLPYGTGLGYGVTVNTPASNDNVYNNTLWNVSKAMTSVGNDFTNVNAINNLSNGSDWLGSNVSRNLTQTANQFTNSAVGDYTLTANSGSSKRAVNYGAANAGLDGIVTADAGAFQSGVTPWTAGTDWKAWTAGNQLSAPLAAALYVTQSGTRVTTGSLTVGNTTSTSANNRSFLNFDLSRIVSTTIQSAILRIYENTLPTSAAGSVTLNRVTSAWTNANVSYNQSVDAASPITGFYDPSNLDLYTDINITSWVQGWLSNSSTNYGLRLCGTEDVTGTAKYFDGFYGVTAPQLVITMPEPGDANLDGRVDVSDLAILAANYRKHVTGGWTQADFNNDGVVDVKDLAILAANYRYGVASDVSLGAVAWDAEAIELLSLAGVTAVPEPGALIMLAVALIGALTYTWRKGNRGTLIATDLR